jgi:catechol 2,3-dioxygenase-like lactoylglutathione lyase family enzyme
MIQHVTREILPSQLDDCVRFYGLLGLLPVAVPPSIGDRAVWLAPPDEGSSDDGRPPVQLHLMPTADARPAPGHVAFVLADYDTAVTRLSDAGYEVEPRAQHWGSPRAYVRDPAANIVELMASAPGDR